MTTQTQTSGAIASLSADSIARDLNRVIDEGRISPADKSDILWFFAHGKKLGRSLSEYGQAIGYDPSTISRVFRGRYEGNWQSVLTAIARYKHLELERAKVARAGFVETSTWQAIRSTCDLAIIHQMPAMIIGVSQIGKTEALLEYQRRSDLRVVYVRMPAAPGFRGAMEAVAESLGVTTRCATGLLRKRVAKALDSRTLLIIDELHQLAISAGKGTAMRVMEWIRELLDVSGCGLVVCGTKAIEQDLINGDLKGWLDQFAQRCIKRLRLPDQLTVEDINAVAASFGLPAAPDQMLGGLRALRMNRLVKTCMLAENLARNRGTTISWELFSQAFAAINN